MPTTLDQAAAAPTLSADLDQALSRIPPLWPLKHFVAVNPFVGLLGLSYADACALLQRTAGRAPLQSTADYRTAWTTGAISPDDLAYAAAPEFTNDELLAALDSTDDILTGSIATVADLLDQERPRAHWSVFVVEEISKWCGVYFDQNQTTWNSPWKNLDLYTAWRESALHDHNPESFGLTGFREVIAGLPADADACIAHCLQLLAPNNIALDDFLHRQLLTISGWAGYAQYLVREDTLRGRANPTLKHLLAIRLAYDAALFQTFARDGVFRADWRHQVAPQPDTRKLAALVRWQLAYELGYQSQLARQLAAAPAAPAVRPRPDAQAIFCIDVRSEVFRRHLETAGPAVIQTIGFAGFFGFPVAHQGLAETTPASRCPVLLVPPVETCEPVSATADTTARHQRDEAGAWKAFQNSAASCFSFVEAAGLAFAGTLGNKARAKGPSCTKVAPGFANAPIETRAALAAGALRNMSLVQNLARLVLVCGHGSQSANNPYASALDCGACGGHAGDVNARLAAAALNEPGVRAILADQGIRIPADTHFIAGLHNTATDDAILYDLDAVPASHQADLTALRDALATAGVNARRERAASLGLSDVPAAQLDQAIRARADDISQVRPEWGLANNAALVAAPRARTSGLKLDGRVFLHDYEAAHDPEDKVLTLILCAPVVVASWINLQYYGSRIDPELYGSGNKVLHNVVGGIGVMEGNLGDLKVGLPLQSIHDGEKFIHEPRRLTVYIEAAPERIEAVLQSQPAVRQLFDHGWIHLIALTGPTAHRRTSTGWQTM